MSLWCILTVQAIKFHGLLIGIMLAGTAAIVLIPCPSFYLVSLKMAWLLFTALVVLLIAPRPTPLEIQPDEYPLRHYASWPSVMDIQKDPYTYPCLDRSNSWSYSEAEFPFKNTEKDL